MQDGTARQIHKQILPLGQFSKNSGMFHNKSTNINHDIPRSVKETKINRINQVEPRKPFDILACLVHTFLMLVQRDLQTMA